jgi:hypothetical protein
MRFFEGIYFKGGFRRTNSGSKCSSDLLVTAVRYLMLPYLQVPINRRVFLNGERARTWNSVIKK